MRNQKDESIREGTTYECSECRLHYRDKETQEKCEAWCREHRSCNIEIIKSAVESEECRESQK